MKITCNKKQQESLYFIFQQYIENASGIYMDKGFSIKEMTICGEKIEWNIVETNVMDKIIEAQSKAANQNFEYWLQNVVLMVDDAYMEKLKKLVIQGGKYEQLKKKIYQSMNYYEERLEEEKYNIKGYKKGICRSNGRIEILRDIADDLKHDLMDVGEVVE